jgi:hypothetical protein
MPDYFPAKPAADTPFASPAFEHAAANGGAAEVNEDDGPAPPLLQPPHPASYMEVCQAFLTLHST